MKRGDKSIDYRISEFGEEKFEQYDKRRHIMPRKKKKRSRPENARKLPVLQMRAKVAEMMARNMSHKEIAERLGISRPAVTYHVRKIKEEWKNKIASNYNDLIAEELHKLDFLENQYWEAWFASAGGKKTVIKKYGSKEKLKGKITKLQQDGVGDPKFLEGVRWCMEKRWKLLRLEQREDNEKTYTQNNFFIGDKNGYSILSRLIRVVESTTRQGETTGDRNIEGSKDLPNALLQSSPLLDHGNGEMGTDETGQVSVEDSDEVS